MEKSVVTGKVTALDMVQDHPRFHSRAVIQSPDGLVQIVFLGFDPQDAPCKVGDSIAIEAESLGGGEWIGYDHTLVPCHIADSRIQYPPQQGEEEILVVESMSGDTVKFYFLVKDTARLYGIDAPPMHGESRDAAIAARKHLESLIEKGKVYKARFYGKDRYGRTLLSLGDVAQKMLDSGLVKPWN